MLFTPMKIYTDEDLNRHALLSFIGNVSLRFNGTLPHFTPFCVENAQMVMFPSLIYARNAGVLNEKRCKSSSV